jgi:hypothetical protein
MKRVKVSGGKVSTFAALEWSTASSQRLGRRWRVRNASVIGAPRAIARGTTIVRIMCWAMCTLSSVSSYPPRPESTARAAEPIPRTTNDSVRPIGQWSPRRRSRTTPHR